jgi:molybdopterin-guanine dinucleotide biosynthesis protein A
MGRPKGLLSCEGAPLLSRIIDRLTNISGDLLCVTCEPSVYEWESPRVRFIPDYGGFAHSPLSGILGALEAARHDVCLVVGVDMPFLNTSLLRYLAAPRH